MIKDVLIKEIDNIVEKIKFWRSVLFVLWSGMIGVLFGITQNKFIFNYSIILIILITFIFTITILKILYDNEIKRQKFLEELKKEK